MKSMATNKIINNPNIYCFSGCKEQQKSADVYSPEQAQPVGAFTDAMLHCLRSNRMNVSIMKLYEDIHKYMQSKGFIQTPMFSSSSFNPDYNFSRINSTNVKTTNSSIVDFVAPPPPPPVVYVPATIPVATKPVPIKPIAPIRPKPLMRLQFS
jgi:hypothetical protein